MTSCIFQKKRAFAFVWLEIELGGPLLRPSCTELAHKCLLVVDFGRVFPQAGKLSVRNPDSLKVELRDPARWVLFPDSARSLVLLIVFLFLTRMGEDACHH